MLRITEIFLSLQGEARDAGWPTLFVRLTGCPLRCTYCDTSYAFTGGHTMTLDAIMEEVKQVAASRGYGEVRHVCVTGGEPLAQRGCRELLVRLCDADYQVSLETSGALDVSNVDVRVVRVMDLKTPGSGEQTKNRWENLEVLTGRDQVKLVIADRNDYEWARAVIKRYRIADRCEVLFSPVFGRIEPRQLADWIIEDRLPVRFQMQLHKLLWGDEPGR
ncbi:7-carboxy-7-deazaguanine synthase QueE [Thiohalomonas denitrificans]|uniref:7-carboxy-7-deazaguanine synthase QueE n=1 Tax=Thiohalomonas denitrificans TaxID=415747 RepID=UPI0026F15D22|nr:7-carboxy-7-deazaguanine synthase QueE [Thiohalomonas denitrificans]